MATDNNIKNFTAADIEKYHKGMLSPKERHALEKAALDDPFLADALEGYATQGVNVSSDIAELKKRLEEKTEKGKVIVMHTGGKRSFPWLRAAAGVILIAGAGFLTYQFAFNNKTENIAQAPGTAKQQPETGADSGTTFISPATADKDSIKPDIATKENNQRPSSGQRTETVKTETLNGGNRRNDTLSVAETNLYSNVTVPARSKNTDDKKMEGLAKDNTAIKPVAAAPAKEKQDDVAAFMKKEADRDGAAEKSAEVSRSNEEAKARAATTARNRAESQQYRNQANVFRGRVTDNSNNGIPFANVTNVQDNVGTYTDARGFFNLTSPDSILNVQTRALGYSPNNIQLRSAVPEIKVTMQEDQSVAADILSNKKVNYERRSRDANFTLEGEPEPEDGWDTYDSYLANNLNIPKDFKRRQSTGNELVEVSFEVTKDGTPVNFKVEKSLCSKCDEEAIRLIKEGPKWKRKARKGRTRVAIAF